ncbi:hypothetical protein [Lewinella sp. 4G2]|uniref:hypothetical protein n=1 Tax=Lewinella sp. 4G2 TaxID=1803372 RepID=UPI001E2D17DB|nr:hypothetical protein [Lewinella sp. 4G2]
MGYGRDRELFTSRNGGGLDVFAMAELSVDNTLKFMLNPHRLARLAEQRALYPDLEVPDLATYLSNTWKAAGDEPTTQTADAYGMALARMVQRRIVEALMRVSKDASAAELVRVATMNELHRISTQLKSDSQNYVYLKGRIDNFLRSPEETVLPPVGSLPDGSPIGCGQ